MVAFCDALEAAWKSFPRWRWSRDSREREREREREKEKERRKERESPIETRNIMTDERNGMLGWKKSMVNHNRQPNTHVNTWASEWRTIAFCTVNVRKRKRDKWKSEARFIHDVRPIAWFYFPCAACKPYWYGTLAKTHSCPACANPAILHVAQFERDLLRCTVSNVLAVFRTVTCMPKECRWWLAGRKKLPGRWWDHISKRFNRCELNKFYHWGWVEGN